MQRANSIDRHTLRIGFNELYYGFQYWLMTAAARYGAAAEIELAKCASNERIANVDLSKHAR